MSTAELTLETAQAEIKGVSWTLLLEAFGIDRTILIQIADQCVGDDPKALSQTLRHWMDNYDYSWDALARALLSIRHYRRKGGYIYNKYVNPECFTPENISKELSFIEDWFELAHPFLHDSDRIRKAVKGTPPDQRRVVAMKAWMEWYDVPSWEEVARVIEDVFSDYENISDQLRKKYLPDVEPMRDKQLEELKDLNSENAFEETSDVTDWYALGWFLGIPEEELDSIENEHPRQDGRRQAVLDLWLIKDTDPTWLELGRAIRKMRSNLGLGDRLIERAENKKPTQVEHQEPQDTTEGMIEEEDHADITAEVSEEASDQSTSNMNQELQDIKDNVIELKDFVGGILALVETLSAEPGKTSRMKSSLELMKGKLNDLETSLSRLSVNKRSEDMVQNTSARTDETAEPITPQAHTTAIPANVLSKLMKVFFEETFSFTSDETCSMNWELYGCKLQIPKGSIDKGEQGTVRIYGIHSGPYYEVHEEMMLVSPTFYISISHNLLKPATLVIEHCCKSVYDANGEYNLTFVSITDTSLGPPYKLKPISGGMFDDQYGIIRRRNFSDYGISYVKCGLSKITSWFLGDRRSSESPPPKKRMRKSSTAEEEDNKVSPIKYGMLYMLKATADPNEWMAKLLLTKYLKGDKQHFLKEETRHHTRVVHSKFDMVELTSDALIIDVSKDDDDCKPLEWNGRTKEIVNGWDIKAGSILKLRTSGIADGLSPSIEIHISWKDAPSPPVKGMFRIHYLLCEDPFHFPVTVPFPSRRGRLSSTWSKSSFSDMSFDESEYEPLFDPPKATIYIDRVAKKLRPSDCNLIAMHLINGDNAATAFIETTKDKEYLERYRLLFDEWKRLETEEPTWEKIISAIKITDNQTLASNLSECYK